MTHAVVTLVDVYKAASAIETMAKFFGVGNASKIKLLFMDELKPYVFGINEQNLPDNVRNRLNVIAEEKEDGT